MINTGTRSLAEDPVRLDQNAAGLVERLAHRGDDGADVLSHGAGAQP